MEVYLLLVLGAVLLAAGTLSWAWPWFWGDPCPVCGRSRERCPPARRQARMETERPGEWTREFIPGAVPEQLRHLRNADGSVNRDAFVVLRGTDTLAPYVANPEKEQAIMGDPTEPAPAPDPTTPPPDA